MPIRRSNATELWSHRWYKLVICVFKCSRDKWIYGRNVYEINNIWYMKWIAPLTLKKRRARVVNLYEELKYLVVIDIQDCVTVKKLDHLIPLSLSRPKHLVAPRN